MSIRDELIEAAHSAICETNLDDCIEWHGRCAKAADAILARHSVVALPAPAVDKWGNPDFSNEHIRLTVYTNGCVQLETPEYFGVNSGIHPFQLRDLAQRCLAAAEHAEGVQS
ncbi:hypothetical protein QYN14_25715 [Rhodococcus ruber]|uniref:hypothetical protein n=1 Tax=Rhodococcus ruber TaxID=1830 RepID=UPI0026599DF7|nr:hypothetical protein [Rhodococcus ruber]WKK11948.1 hypothetical protein QYN14_25300 [Rhodococcus ruber]WKK12031.1 hypothetical protein QYN14_25715 [Rhodococcus ruber]